MRQVFRKFLILVLAVGTGLAPGIPILSPAGSSFIHLAPAPSPVLPEELAARWVAAQIQGMLRRGDEVTQASLIPVEKEIAARMRFNPWEIGLEWIWLNPKGPVFEYVLGGGLYTVTFNASDPRLPYNLEVFRLDTFLETTRAPLLKTAAAEQAIGVQPRVLENFSRPPSFEEEQDRMLAISIGELHSEILAFEKQAKFLRETGQWDRYKNKQTHFVQWAQRLESIFPEPNSLFPEVREEAREQIRGAVRLLEKRNWSAALARLVAAKKRLWQEQGAYQYQRFENQRLEEYWHQEQEFAASLVHLGRFLIDGEGAVETKQAYWYNGQDPLDGSARKIRLTAPAHFASQRDYISSRVAAIKSIRIYQERYKVYLRMIHLLDKVAALMREADALKEMQWALAYYTLSREQGAAIQKEQVPLFLKGMRLLYKEKWVVLSKPAIGKLKRLGEGQNGEKTPEELNREVNEILDLVEFEGEPTGLWQQLQGRAASIFNDLVGGMKALLVEGIKEANQRIRAYEEERDHHEKRLAALREEEKFPHALRPAEKLAKQIKESTAIVNGFDKKTAPRRAAIEAAKTQIVFYNQMAVSEENFNWELYQNVRSPFGVYLNGLLERMKKMAAENRLAVRDQLIRTINYLFPDLEAAKEKQIPLLQDKQWEDELWRVSDPQYQDARRALAGAYNKLVEVLYEQDSQIRYYRDKLREEKDKFFKRVIRGMRLKGMVNQALAIMEEEEPDLKFLWFTLKAMEDLLRGGNGAKGRPLPEADLLARTPLLVPVRNLQEYLVPVGGLYQNEARQAGVEILDFIEAAFPNLASKRTAEYPPVTDSRMAQLRTLSLRVVEKLGLIQTDHSRTGREILTAIESLVRRFQHLVAGFESALGENEEVSFPQSLLIEYGELGAAYERIRRRIDPRAILGVAAGEEIPGFKTSENWKKMEREIGSLKALLDPPPVAEAGSPLIKRPHFRPAEVVSFEISPFERIRNHRKDVRRIRVILQNQPAADEMPLFKEVPAEPRGREIQKKLTAAFERMINDPIEGEANWKRAGLIKKISVLAGLDKMADFNRLEVQLDEDLFGSEAKEIPFNEDLLVLELQLKIDHLEALSKRGGIPPTPQQLALDKIRFLKNYIQRFLELPPESREKLVLLLQLNRAELDLGGFGSLLFEASEWYLKGKTVLEISRVVNRFVEEKIVPYVKRHYSPMLKRGVELLETERVPIAIEIENPSFLLTWETEKRGQESLRLSMADMEDLESFYDVESNGSKQMRLDSVKGELGLGPSNQARFLVKVTDRTGKILSWALVARIKNAQPFFEMEMRAENPFDRLWIQDFDVTDEKRGLKPLLMYLAISVTLNKEIVSKVQIHLSPDKFKYLSLVPDQVRPDVAFPAEEFEEEEERISGRSRETAREIFFDSGVLFDRYWDNITLQEEVGFHKMVQEAFRDPARLSDDRGWFYLEEPPERWAYHYGRRKKVSESSPLTDLSRVAPDERKNRWFAFFSSQGEDGIFFNEEKILLIDKGVDHVLQLPLVEELEADKSFDELAEILKQHRVFNEAAWRQARTAVGKKFLLDSLTLIEEKFDLADNPEKYAGALSWLTGSRIRLIHTDEAPEWIMEEIDPYLEDPFSKEAKAALKALLLTSIKEAGESLFEEGADVKARGRELGSDLEEMRRVFQSFNWKNRDAWVMNKFISTLRSLIEWSQKLKPRFKQNPVSLIRINEILAPMGELTDEEFRARQKVYGASAALDAARLFLTSDRAKEQIQKWTLPLEMKAAEFHIQATSGVASEPAPVLPFPNSRLESAI